MDHGMTPATTAGATRKNSTLPNAARVTPRILGALILTNHHRHGR
jgi:hypothetical protein